MITGALMLLVELLLKLIWLILGTISFVIPDVIGETWVTLFGYAHTLDSIFPVTQGLLALVFLANVLIVSYVAKLLFMAWHLTPVVGSKTQARLPSHTADVASHR